MNTAPSPTGSPADQEESSAPRAGRSGSERFFTAERFGAKPWQAYLFAIVATAATLIAGAGLKGLLHGQSAAIIFIIPIVFSAYLGGWRAGLVATLLAALCCAYLLLADAGHERAHFASEQWLQVLVVVAGGVVTFLLEALHRARRRAEGMIARQIAAEAALRESEERFSATFEQAAVGIAHVSCAGALLRVNGKLGAVLGYGAEELLGRALADLVLAEDRASVEVAHTSLISGELPAHTAEVRLRRQDGSSVWMNFVAALERSATGEPECVIAVFEDISLRKLTEARLHRLNRLHTVLSRTREATARIGERPALYEQACRIAVEEGLLLMASVVEVDAARQRAVPAASWGEGQEYLRTLQVSAAGGALGEGTIGRALLSGTYNVCNDFARDPRMAPWRDAALAHGFRSTASFPLRCDGAVVAAIVLFAGEPDYFRADEIELMVAVADELSFGLEAQAREQQREEAEAALRTSERNMATAQSIAHFGSWEIDLDQTDEVDANSLRWSDEMYRIVGYEPGEVAVSSAFFFSLVPAEEHVLIRGTLAAAVAAKGRYSIWHRLVRRDGQERIMREEAQVWTEEKTGRLKITGTMQDVTEQRRDEDRLRQQAHMLDNVGQAIIATDLFGRVTYANRHMEQLYGWPQAEILGRDVMEITVPQISHDESVAIMTRLRQGEKWSGELMVQNRDGRVFPAFVTDSPLHNERGELIGIVGISEDITERKLAAEQLRANEVRLRLLCDIMSRADLGLNEQTQQLLQAGCRQLGLDHGILARVDAELYTIEIVSSEGSHKLSESECALRDTVCREVMHREELIAYECASGSDWGTHPGFLAHRYEAYIGTLVCVARQPYGTICFTSMKPHPRNFTPADIEFVRLIAQWVSGALERRAALVALNQGQQMLATSHRMNQQILDSSLDVICTVDAGGRFTSMSAIGERVFGYPPAEMVGRQFIDFVVPAEREATLRTVAELPAGRELYDYANRYLRKDGTVVPMSWSAVWSQRDQSIFCVGRDCTERAAAEEAHAARKVADASNRAKSEFLSRMSHELRTPLHAILGFAQLLETNHLQTEDQDSVAQIVRAGDHLLGLINEVLDLASMEAGKLTLSMEPVSVRHTFEETLSFVRPQAAARQVRLELRPANLDCAVVADPRRLKQVIVNLLSNAVKFNRTGGAVFVSSAISGDRVRLQVEDTGRGISPENLARLFVPFERLDITDVAIEGAGLGLSIAKQLVEAMDGKVGGESVLGQGATFWVELPLFQGSAPSAPDLAPPGSGESARSTVPRTLLYIEDNLSNLRLVERILARRPEIKLLSALQGSLGLELAQQQPADLILLDVHLPDMSGREVLQQLRADPRTAEIPVFMMSADATAPQIEAMMAAGAQAYLTKPISVREFLALVDATTPRHSAPAASPAPAVS